MTYQDYDTHDGLASDELPPPTPSHQEVGQHTSLETHETLSQAFHKHADGSVDVAYKGIKGIHPLHSHHIDHEFSVSMEDIEKGCRPPFVQPASYLSHTSDIPHLVPHFFRPQGAYEADSMSDGAGFLPIYTPQDREAFLRCFGETQAEQAKNLLVCFKDQLAPGWFSFMEPHEGNFEPTWYGAKGMTYYVGLSLTPDKAGYISALWINAKNNTLGWYPLGPYAADHYIPFLVCESISPQTSSSE